MRLEMKQLSECPEHLQAVGTWIFSEWWFRVHKSPEIICNILRTHTEKDRVPYTVVALADGSPVGSCSVMQNDGVHRPELTPWVAAVYVKAPYRKQGIASMILQEAAIIGKRAGIQTLYIDCLETTARVYEKNGWKYLEHLIGDEKSVVLYRKLSQPGN